MKVPMKSNAIKSSKSIFAFAALAAVLTFIVCFSLMNGNLIDIRDMLFIASIAIATFALIV